MRGRIYNITRFLCVDVAARSIWVFVKGVCRHCDRHVRHNLRRLTHRYADKRECRNPQAQQEDVNPSKRLPLSVHTCIHKHTYTLTHTHTHLYSFQYSSHHILFLSFYLYRRFSIFLRFRKIPSAHFPTSCLILFVRRISSDLFRRSFLR